MSLVDNLLKGDTGKGLAVGLGAALLAPVAFAVLSGVGRPLTRAVIKSGMIIYEKGLETAAEFGEVIEDLAAEARAEIEQSHSAAAGETQSAEEVVAEADTEIEDSGDKA